MADSLTIDADASVLLAQLALVDDSIGEALKLVAAGTAERVRDEARARLARQTHGSGQTAEAITIEDIPGGYRVYVAPTSRPLNLPLWLEVGTRRMEERPFLWAAARLEEGPHLRRVSAAVERALAAVDR